MSIEYKIFEVDGEKRISFTLDEVIELRNSMDERDDRDVQLIEFLDDMKKRLLVA